MAVECMKSAVAQTSAVPPTLGPGERKQVVDMLPGREPVLGPVNSGLTAGQPEQAREESTAPEIPAGRQLNNGSTEVSGGNCPQTSLSATSGAGEHIESRDVPWPPGWEGEVLEQSVGDEMVGEQGVGGG